MFRRQFLAVSSPRLTAALVFAFAVSACDGSRELMAPRTDGPSFSIQDAVHEGGNRHLFWLPPMVPAPGSFNGPFDASQSPVVEICEWTGMSCVTPLLASFTMDTGPGSETVRVVSVDEHYIVNWHTDQWELDATKTYRIRALIDGEELGHADVDLVNGGKELRNVNTNEYVALKNGRTLPIKFRIEEGALPEGFGLVAFDRGVGGSDRDVFVLDSRTQIVTRLTQNPATDVKPVFSPDGQWVVFASNRTGGWELYRTLTDGSGSLQKLTPGTQGDATGITGIDWNPDGSTIIFSARVSNIWRLFEMPSSGGTPTQLLSTTFGGANMDVQFAQYSRDGVKIYHHRTTPFNASNSDIYSADADGSNEVKLTSLPGRGAGFPTEIFVNGVAKVVYTEWNPSAGGSSHQVIMNTDGSSPVAITAEDGVSEHDAVGPAGNISASLEGIVIITRQASGLPDLIMLGSDGTVLMDPVIADAFAADWWIP